ncbi:uncharacterized protein EDB93DRAFT_1164015 [Suillus bovinus]|uniref:uncharacterized protein n=1 Tax=Suillus bovinus TaxID=48563 RepID=UPI001B87459D|nr:uncharacterized protein EDB93DRAFT_1164015 [Suillus bovinus]KAG2139078.1 hypothetical protein EDB93DRAFT_1164015 [Suillus bovinus]
MTLLPLRSRPTLLQSYLECLDRHSERMMNTYREMLEIRACITELLSSDRSDVIEGTLDGTVDIQAMVHEPQTIAPSALDEINAIAWPSNLPTLFPEPLAFYDQLSDNPLVSVGITGLEGVAPPLSHIRSDVLPWSSSSSDGYNTGVHNIMPQHGMYSERQTLSSSSTRRDEPCIMQDKVQCTRPGCSSVVNKNCLTRHINEVHERKVKARCAGCGKGFARPYMLEDHIRRAKCENP